MQLTQEFSVPIPVDQAWDLLTDLETVVPCMPGASITSVDGDDFEGSVRLRVGPITMALQGTGSFVERDAEARRAVIHASGADGRGSAGASAVITARLTGTDDATTVSVMTDLEVTGRAAQFGGAVLNDVSSKLTQAFAQNLAARLEEDLPSAAGAAGASGGGRTSAEQVRHTEPAAEVNAMNLLPWGALASKGAPVGAGLGIFLVGYLWGANRAMRRQLR